MVRITVVTILVLVFASGLMHAAVIGTLDIAALQAGVVKITASSSGETQKVGTGFIVRLEKDVAYIVTAAHVIAGDAQPNVQFFTQQDVSIRATVRHSEGGDEVTGLALLIVRGEDNLPSGLTALTLASASRLSGNEEIAVIGHPRGAGDWAILKGGIAGRQGRYVSIDANIDEGNSGGPIIHGGEVVGLVGGVTRYGRGVTAGSVREYLEGHGIFTQEATPPSVAKVLPSEDHQHATDAQTGSIDYSNFEQAKKAAERGDSRAMFQLAEMYTDGKGVPENFSEAAKWYRRSADAGYPSAHTAMGLLSLIKAAGFAGDDVSAIRFGSDESKSEEITNLISRPEKIRNGNQADIKDAVTWFRRAAEQGNEEKAQMALGIMLLNGVGVQKDYSQAAKMFQLASTKVPDAQAILGQFYFGGTGVKQDFHEAARHLREAAEKGADISFWMLGYVYMEGLGVVQDPAEAAKWFWKGLAQGDSSAKAYLGLLHFVGRGVPQDFSKAYTLAREAAEQGNKVGQYLIGMIFFSGKGAPKNSQEGLKWMQSAARQGEPHAQTFLREQNQTW